MGDFAERYGTQLVKLADRNRTMNEFEFDQILLMPTVGGYRSLVEQADIEIAPERKSYLLKFWSEGTLENLSYLPWLLQSMLEVYPIRLMKLMLERFFLKH